MGAGKPVRMRTEGFANDVAALTRLRTALKLDRSLPKEAVNRATLHLDNLVESLSELHELKKTA